MDRFTDMLMSLNERMHDQDKKWPEQEEQLQNVRHAVTTPDEEDLEPMTTPLFRHQLDAAIEAVEMARHAVQTMEEKRERMISEVNAIKSYYRTFIDLQAREIVRDQLLEGLQTFGNAMMEYGEMERHFDLYQQYLVNNTMYHLPASLLEHIKANKPKQGE